MACDLLTVIYTNLSKVYCQPPCNTEATCHSQCLARKAEGPSLKYPLGTQFHLVGGMLTPFRPIKSAIRPLVIAPIIAPNVNMDPNNEYYI